MVSGLPGVTPCRGTWVFDIHVAAHVGYGPHTDCAGTIVY